MVIASLAGVAVLAVAALMVPRQTRRPVPVPTPHPVQAFGARIRALWGRPRDRERDLLVGAVALWAVAGGLVLGPLGLGVGLVRAGAPVVQQRRRDRGRHRELWRQLPEAADLLALCLSAGLPVAAAVATVSGALDGPVGAALTRIDRRHREGQRFAQAVSAVLVEVSADLRPLLTTIGAAHVDGGPVVESLRRLAADHRQQRRRHGEAEARRVPVMLLFPLVCCILPAFVLIALVPLIAGSVGELSFP